MVGTIIFVTACDYLGNTIYSGNISDMEPKTGTKIADLTPVFRWKIAYGTQRYEIRIADSIVALSTASIIEVMGNTYTPTIALEKGINHYWQVRVIDENGYAGEWTTEHSFEIQDTYAIGDIGLPISHYFKNDYPESIKQIWHSPLKGFFNWSYT